MSSSDSRIHPTIVLFTPTSTIISPPDTLPSTSYLKVQILPTPDGKNIQSIEVWSYNPTCTPSRLNEVIDDSHTFQQLVSHIKGSGSTLVDKAANYMCTLSSEELSIITKEYSKYVTESGVLIDVFISGIGAYLAFLLLNENGSFMNQIPFQFGVLHSVRSGMTITKNMFEYLSLPLSALTRSESGVVKQVCLFIQSFINLWEPLFLPGPYIDPSHTARISIEVINGFSQHVANSLAKTQDLSCIITQQLKSIETRLQSYVDESIAKMRRELSNLTIEARGAIKELNESSQRNRLDESIRKKISEISEVEIKNAIQRELGICYDAMQNQVDTIYSNQEIIMTHKQYRQGLEEIKDSENQDNVRISDKIPTRIQISHPPAGTTPGPPISNIICADPISNAQNFPNRIHHEEQVVHTSNLRGPITGQNIGNNSVRGNIDPSESCTTVKWRRGTGNKSGNL